MCAPSARRRRAIRYYAVEAAPSLDANHSQVRMFWLCAPHGGTPRMPGAPKSKEPPPPLPAQRAARKAWPFSALRPLAEAKG